MTEQTHLRPLPPTIAASLPDYAQRVLADVAAALDRYYSMLERIKQLEQAGIVNASIHMRAEKYMYLIHPTQPDGSRRREYIGADPTRQADARARLDRYQEHQQLTQRANQLRAQLEQAARDLSTISYHLKEK